MDRTRFDAKSRFVAKSVRFPGPNDFGGYGVNQGVDLLHNLPVEALAVYFLANESHILRFGNEQGHCLGQSI